MTNFEELPDVVSPANPMYPRAHAQDKNVLVCPFWADRNPAMPCRKISCLDCGAEVSMHACNAPYVAKGTRPICLKCFAGLLKAAKAVASRPSPDIREAIYPFSLEVD